MSIESIAITTSDDLQTAFGQFSTTFLEPLLRQLGQEIRKSVQKDIRIEFLDIARHWQELRSDLQLMAHEVKLARSNSVTQTGDARNTSSTDDASKLESTSNTSTKSIEDALKLESTPIRQPSLILIDSPKSSTADQIWMDSPKSTTARTVDRPDTKIEAILGDPECKKAEPEPDPAPANSNGVAETSERKDAGSLFCQAASLERLAVSSEACAVCGNIFMTDSSFCRKCGTRRRRRTSADIMQIEPLEHNNGRKPVLKRGASECNLNNVMGSRTGSHQPFSSGSKAICASPFPDPSVASFPTFTRQNTQRTINTIISTQGPMLEEEEDVIPPVSREVFMTRRKCVLRDSMDKDGRKQLEELILNDGHAGAPQVQNGQILPSDPQDSQDPSEYPGSRAPSQQSKNSCNFTESSSRRTGMCSSRFLKHLVLSSEFDYLAGIAIVLNAIMLGVQTDHMARKFTDEVPTVFQVLEKCFAVVFTLELALRLFTFRSRFFYMQGWKWNYFDMFVVGTQNLEECMSWFAPAGSGGGNNFGALRMLRVLRLVRIVRLVRVLRLIGELRTIVVSMMGCMKSLFWTMLLLLLMIYMIGVYLTQLVTDHKVMNREPYMRDQLALEKYFGSLGSSILTLFGSITGGVNWDSPVEPLMDYISPLLSLVFAAYISFALLAMMNVVTGVFVESALENAKRDKDLYLLHHVKKLFADVDEDGSGSISWKEFHHALDNPNMKVYFDACELDVAEAEQLFTLLDVDESGSIDRSEFVNCFFKLRGNAKAIDLAMLSFGFERLGRKFQVVEDTMHELRTTLVPNSVKEPRAVSVSEFTEKSLNLNGWAETRSK